MQPKPTIKVAEPKYQQRFPVYLTIEEVSHIILAVEYADVDNYCDDTVLADINARLGSVLANYVLASK